ncbi:MAG TPA: helix-turn-helix domain-containing protein, partial [Nocardioides sp.]|nr:helix-turn-helix domain-containing protein [Nocardioides sp.]
MVGSAEEGFARRVTTLGALADPVRRALYRFVSDQDEAVSREQAAEGVEVPRHTAKFHLDRLVDEGLLVTEFRRLTGRTGPGAGRPAKLYRRSAREVSVSLPHRRYDLAAEVLADAIERSLQGT